MTHKMRISWVLLSVWLVLGGVLLLTAAASAFAQGALVWATRAEGTDFNFSWGRGIAADGAGGSLVTGSIEGTVTFGAGEPNETTLTSSGFLEDIFVAHYNAQGALLWATRAGGTGGDRGFGIAADGAGGSVVTGSFWGTATYGEGEPNETTLTSAGSGDIFVARYDAQGALLWATRAGGAGRDEALAMAGDAAGGGVVTGEFFATATFGAGEANETTLTSAGSGDIFVARYDAQGALLWATRAGGSGGDWGTGIAGDGAGGSVVTGNFSDTATFGAGESNETTLTSAAGAVGFMARYDAQGALIWATRAGGVGIAADGAGGSVVTGGFWGTATFGKGEPNETTLTSAGAADIFVARYDAQGALLWATRAGGTRFDSGTAIAGDGTGGSVVTGDFTGTATFGAGEPNETTLVATSGSVSIFVARYDAQGALLWATQAWGVTILSSGIAWDGAGGGVVTGLFEGTATFGAGEPNETTFTSAFVASDIFVARWGTISPFARFDIAKARVKLAERAGRDRFQVAGGFRLGAESDGVDVLNEEVAVTFNGFTETIPPGSFRRVRRRDEDEGLRGRHFLFKGSPGGIRRLELTVGGAGGRFSIKAKGLDLDGLELPATVAVALRIGDDVGQTTIWLNRKGWFIGRGDEEENERD